MKKEKRPVIDIHTDGSYKQQIGGYAGVMLCGNHCMAVVGRDESSPDNDRMELKAAVSCLKQINTPARVTLTSDSKYVVNGINTWMHNWKRNGWKTQSNKPCANRDLWEEMAELRVNHIVKAEWVKGHLKNPATTQEVANAVCDELAQKAAEGNL